MIKWDITREDALTIGAIVKRATKAGSVKDPLSLNMDITACHLNGCPLKLSELLNAEPFDFAHDIHGITAHIDRETGALRDCFVPRFAV